MPWFLDVPLGYFLDLTVITLKIKCRYSSLTQLKTLRAFEKLHLNLLAFWFDFTEQQGPNKNPKAYSYFFSYLPILSKKKKIWPLGSWRCDPLHCPSCTSIHLFLCSTYNLFYVHIYIISQILKSCVLCFCDIHIRQVLNSMGVWAAGFGSLYQHGLCT